MKKNKISLNIEILQANFHHKFHFLMSFVSFGFVQIILGIETILRQSYNPFTDPAFLLLLFQFLKLFEQIQN